ncbi:MAG: DUF167 domain-containing protein [Thaumarchaeota archaeon]|nr:DUF167 domain-containing protein [Nitrososphaerota archaeon]MDE1817507.1 DUF167 domain-containing protein [Nitrososphaerota archaeon]MDE1876419.1 DUF167 domain-containing protein [Nitrososphaerota archaeon]
MFYRVTVSFHKDYLKIKNDLIEIGIMEKPVKSKANAVIIKQIAKHLGVSKSKVRIVAGEKSQDKIVEVLQ